MYPRVTVPSSSACDLFLGVFFVTFSEVNRDLRLGYQKVTWKKLVGGFSSQLF